MYTILVNPDSTLYGSQKSRVMQRSKLVDELRFIVEPIYNGIDMTTATVMLEYVLPVSRKHKTTLLVLDDERYNDCYLQYKLPFDTDLTSEAGSLELQLTFAYVHQFLRRLFLILNIVKRIETKYAIVHSQIDQSFQPTQTMVPV